MSSTTQIPYESVSEAPLGDEFLAFMNHIGEDAGRYTELETWMHDELNTTNDRILAAFTLVATGCFKRGKDAHVAECVVEELETICDIKDSQQQKKIATEIQSRLEAIDSDAGRWEWLHSHRKNIHFKFSEAGSVVVESLVGLAEVVGAHGDLETYFNARKQAADDPFHPIFNDVKSVPRFGRLSAFNFLEIVDTTCGVENITPQVPRIDYIRTANPKPGFFYVFLADGPHDDSVENMEWEDAKRELGVDEEGLDKLVQLLCQEAREKLNWSEDLVMYDVESCLCIFAKDAGNRKPNGGDQNDSSATGSGC